MAKIKRVTKRKLKAWIKDEKMASKEYASYGFTEQAEDEAGHARFFTEIMRKMK